MSVRLQRGQPDRDIPAGPDGKHGQVDRATKGGVSTGNSEMRPGRGGARGLKRKRHADRRIRRSPVGGARGVRRGSFVEFLREFPTVIYAGDAADAAEDKGPNEAEPKGVAERPTGVAADRRSGEDAQLGHAPMLVSAMAKGDSRIQRLAVAAIRPVPFFAPRRDRPIVAALQPGQSDRPGPAIHGGGAVVFAAGAIGVSPPPYSKPSRLMPEERA